MMGGVQRKSSAPLPPGMRHPGMHMPPPMGMRGPPPPGMPPMHRGPPPPHMGMVGGYGMRPPHGPGGYPPGMMEHAERQNALDFKRMVDRTLMQ